MNFSRNGGPLAAGGTFFHGTNADLPLGGILVPGEELGHSANHGRSAMSTLPGMG